MQPPRPTEIAHWILQKHIQGGDIVVDATTGNGHDTAFLARCVGETGIVHAIDIQPQAIVSAKARVADLGLSSRVTWHVGNHAEMAQFIPAQPISAIVFNLGYLPGGDHVATTNHESTTTALESAAKLVRPGGLLSILCYPGHPEGAKETQLIASILPDWSDKGWRTASYSLPFTDRPSPLLWVASKPPSR